MKEKEKDERNKKEEKNKKEREEKERQKQLEKEKKYRLKEEKDRMKQKEREEREKEKKREKEEREREKQRLREERRKYNERFQNASAKIKRNFGRYNQNQNPIDYNQNYGKGTQTGGYFQRMSYSNKLYRRKRRHSHKKIQPRNRIPWVEPKKNLGKTSLKIIKPKRYDDDESETEPIDFEEKLMKFPKFKAKYGKNYILKNKNKFDNLNSYLTESGRNMGATKKTNLTISEVDEEEEKNNRYKNIKKGKLAQIKPKGKMSMDKKMREILGKQYKILVDDPLNPYSTCWPSNFLKAGYDTGFEYENFQSGVPVLKLRSLGKKPLPPIKKKGLHFNNDNNNTINSIYSPKRNSKGQNIYPGSSAKKNFYAEIHDIKTNKSDNIQFNKEKIKLNDEESHKLNDITEENDN